MAIDEQLRAQLDAIFDRVYVPQPGAGFTFPETVTKLYELGVTRYRVDFVTSTTTAYIGGQAHSYHFPSYAPVIEIASPATPVKPVPLSAILGGEPTSDSSSPQSPPRSPTTTTTGSLVSPLSQTLAMELEQPNGQQPGDQPRFDAKPHPPLTINTLVPGMIPWSLEKLRMAIKKAREDAKNLKPDLPTYTRQIIEAGVVDYTVFIEGRKVMYTGRMGEAYSAWFMGAGPDAPINKGYSPIHKTPLIRRNTLLG
ncbi:uncharacterized protein PV09_09502 [Verruconis gallopava]|uniref:Uncharacterized protein n=1 Tax=Verruconis gallopava TaxID=253628 RepID=A0A0D1X9A2_9PEZI|nr:uncharacterized protein PV09_09502 [Verruconis gallopava]KIV98715.1 hypothetical protein PV09_09502 [Verruconis gallopava]